MKQKDCNKVFVVGGPGSSGSSTIAKMLSDYFKVPLVYGGGIFRQKAKEEGFDNFEEYLIHVTKHGYYVDNEIDEEFVRRAQEGNVVIDSKSFAMIAYNMDLPCTIKIWVTADLETRVNRRLDREGYKGLKRLVNKFKIKNRLKKRFRIDRDKYWALYRTHYESPQDYNDIVLDTSDIDEKETFNLILTFLKDGGYIK